MENSQAAAVAPLAFFCCIFGVILIFFILLIVFIIKKTKDNSWIGKVIDKKMTTSRDMDTDMERDYYTLVVETVEGKKKNLGVGQKLYDEFKVGDKIRKDKGELHPKKSN